MSANSAGSFPFPMEGELLTQLEVHGNSPQSYGQQADLEQQALGKALGEKWYLNWDWVQKPEYVEAASSDFVA